MDLDSEERIQDLGRWTRRKNDHLQNEIEILKARVDEIEILLLKNGLLSKERLPEPQLKPEKTSKVRDILPIYEDSERR